MIVSIPLRQCLVRIDEKHEFFVYKASYMGSEHGTVMSTFASRGGKTYRLPTQEVDYVQ